MWLKGCITSTASNLLSATAAWNLPMCFWICSTEPRWELLFLAYWCKIQPLSYSKQLIPRLKVLLLKFTFSPTSVDIRLWSNQLEETAAEVRPAELQSEKLPGFGVPPSWNTWRRPSFPGRWYLQVNGISKGRSYLVLVTFYSVAKILIFKVTAVKMPDLYGAVR